MIICLYFLWEESDSEPVSKLFWDLGGKWASPALAAASQEAAEPVLVLQQALCSSTSPGTLLQVLWPSPRARVTPDLISPQPVLLWAAVMWYWWNITLSCGLWLPDYDSPALWFVMHSIKLSSNLLLLLGYIFFWVAELCSWILFSHYVQSKQGQCSDIAAWAVNIA